MDETAAKAADRAIGHLITSIVEGISSKAKAEYDKFIFDLESGFTKYAHVTYDRCSKIKTLLHRHHPIPLRDGYVASAFRIGRKEIEEQDFLNRIGAGGKFVVTGFAGSGKSVFMKSAYLQFIENTGYGFPVFIELRHLKDEYSTDHRLQDFMYKRISASSRRFSKTQFKYALRKGALTLLLDGFDELPIAIRDSVAKDIHEISDDYSQTPVVVSSRPDSRFHAWDDFSEAKLLPMTKEKVVELIDRIDFERSKKANFKKSLISGMYEEQKSFLSNPLLATMMLLIFDLVGEIPKKKHIFYEKSFDVLCREHDSLKREFTREMHSGLDIDDLKSLFQIFCTLTYLDQKYEFTEGELFSYIADSLEMSELRGDIQEKFISKDFMESISIMQQDGDIISFVHRSFQEYFFAKYAVTTHDVDMEELLLPVIDLFETDDILLMIHDMDAKHLECDFLLPAIRKIEKEVSGIDPERRPADILKPFVATARIIRLRSGDQPGEWRRTYTRKKRKDRPLDVLAATCRLGIVDQDILFKEDIVDKEFMESSEITSRLRRIAVRSDNNTLLIQAGHTKFAARIQRAVSEAIKQLAENCSNRSEKRSKFLLERVKKRRSRPPFVR